MVIWQLLRFIDHNGRSPNGLATLRSIVGNCIYNGCADIFFLRNLSGPLVHVLLVLLESDPYLHDKLLKSARPWVGACKREIDDRPAAKTMENCFGRQTNRYPDSINPTAFARLEQAFLSLRRVPASAPATAPSYCASHPMRLGTQPL